MKKRYKIIEYFDMGGWGPLVGSFTLDEAYREIRRLTTNGSVFVHYGIQEIKDDSK